MHTIRAIAISLLLIGCVFSNLIAASQAELRELQAEIEIIRSEIQKNTASFLLITKQMGQGAQNVQHSEQIAQIKNFGAPVREADLESAPILVEAIEGEEFIIIEQRNDWFRIALEDGREGWLFRDDVILVQRGANPNPVSGDPRVRQMAERLYENIQEQFKRAERLFVEFDRTYNKLSSQEKSEAATIQSSYLEEKQKINTYLAYVSHYYSKLTPFQPASSASTTGLQEIDYQGTASLRLGTSSFESATKQSTTSRNLNLNGSVIFNPQSRLHVNINHNNDVVQTPYTSNDVNLNFQHQTSGGSRLQGSVLYNSYNDDAFERNNFQNIGLGAKIDHPFNASTRIFGDVQANSKSFDVEGGNEFDGVNFNSGLNYNGEKAQAAIGIRGRAQSSDVSFLDYFRIIPNANIRWLTGSGKSFGIRAEAEQLSYAAEAEGNDFNRGRVDIQWAGSTKSTSLIVIAKQFPNNEAFDNYRFRMQNEWRRTSGAGSARTAFSLQYVYHPQEDTQLDDYFDLRLDRNSSGRKGYFDLNIFGRYWNEIERDHRIDIFSRFGFKFSQLQIGPAVGAQLLLNQDDLQIERNGNSFRAGIDARANAAIQQATVYGTFRYQKSLVYNNKIDIDRNTGTITQGEIETLLPTTIQFSAGVQVPIMDLLDLKIDASYYNINLDLSDEISINPVQTRSGLRVLAGVSYRFQRN